MPEEWIIQVEGREYGPVDLQILREWKEEGRVLPANQARRAEANTWIQASGIPGLFDSFVVPDDVVMESPDRQIRMMDATDTHPDIQVGEFIEEPIENPEFGRIAAQAAKQVLIPLLHKDTQRNISDLSPGFPSIPMSHPGRYYSVALCAVDRRHARYVLDSGC